MPAIRATMAGTWAAVMTISKSPNQVSCARGCRIEAQHILRRGSTVADADDAASVPPPPARGTISGTEQPTKSGTMRHPMHWEGHGWQAPRPGSSCRLKAEAHRQCKEITMRNRYLAIAAIAGALGTPLAAQAQDVTVGVARDGYVAGAPTVAVAPDGIAIEQRPAFREYVVRERVPTYTVPDRVVVG